MLSPTPIPAAVVEASRRGDPDAWDTLIRRYQLPLFTYIMDLVRDRHTSLDIVQESLAQAVRHIGSLKNPDRFGSWIFGIAHQRIIQRWRRQGRCPFSDEPVPECPVSPVPSPDQTAIALEEVAALRDAIDDLPPAQRSVILLHFLEDFPLAEIAQITGTSLGTVKSRLHYAKRSLRSRLASPPETQPI